MKLIVKKANGKNVYANSYYYVMVAVNGEVLLTSEMYTSKANANRAAIRLINALRKLEMVVE